MSNYGRMEAGAAPGARDRNTGPVGLYSVSPFRHGSSRALNRTEREAKVNALDKEMEDRIEKVRKAMSVKYLKFLRRQIAGFKTHNHVIKIIAGMGSISLKVNNTWVSDFRRCTPLIDRLQEIDQLLEGSWDWAAYLDEAVLNPK